MIGGLGRIAAVLVAVHVFSFVAWADYGGGRGTPESPYLIFTAGQLNALGAQPGDWDKHFRLMADIDLGGYHGNRFHRIGTPEDGPFTGTFDGNYRTVSNFQWSADWTRYVGLFGFVDADQAQIVNVTLVGPSVAVETGQYIAALVGYFRAGTVVNCHVRHGTISGDTSVGALIGRKDSGTVTDCTALAAVRGASRVGGLIGHSYWGLVEHCDAAGQVTGTGEESDYWATGGLIGYNQNGVVTDCHARCTVEGYQEVGGLIGLNATAGVRRCWADGRISGEQDIGGLIGRNEGGTVSDCYSLADASGTAYVGGLVGWHAASCGCTAGVPGLIERCYAAGPVSGLSNLGGLTAVCEKSSITTSFWDMQTTGCDKSAGGAGKTTKQMQHLSTYAAVGWDFAEETRDGTEDIWRVPSPGVYPWLTWQTVTGDLDGDGNVDFRDFSLLARQWRRTDSGFWPRTAFIAADGIIDLDDLDALTQTWLAGSK
jgi:hypothetical protein